MKTLAKLVYVEPDEEVTDVIDRLRELRGEDAVTLVLPDGARSLHSPMSFRLLKKYAEALGLRLSVISAESRLQALALESGFPTYATIQAYDRGLEVLQPGALVAVEEAPTAAVARPVTPAPAVTPRPVVSAPPARRPFSGVPLLRERLADHRRSLYIAGAIIAGIAFLAGMLYLPTATVSIAVQGIKLDADIQLTGAPDNKTTAGNQFATQAFNVSESQQAQGTATGQKQIAAIFAKGSVVFTNKGVLIVVVPRGYQVATTDGVRFTTQADTGEIKADQSSKPVSVVANNAGQAGNVPAHSILVSNNSYLAVDNAAATAGGADSRTATVISDSDAATATQALLDVLNPKVQDELNQKTGGLHLVQESLIIDHTTTMDHRVGDELSAAPFTFNITVTVTGKATAFNDAAVRQLIQKALQRKVPDGQQLTEDPISTGYDVVSAGADGKVTLNGHAHGFVRPVFSIADIRARLKGKSPGSARPLLSSLPDVVDVNVRQDPLPLPWLPFFSSRIFVKVQEATGGFAS